LEGCGTDLLFTVDTHAWALERRHSTLSAIGTFSIHLCAQCFSGNTLDLVTIENLLFLQVFCKTQQYSNFDFPTMAEYKFKQASIQQCIKPSFTSVL